MRLQEIARRRTLLFLASLRWHYPNQVRSKIDLPLSLSHRLPRFFSFNVSKHNTETWPCQLYCRYVTVVSPLCYCSQVGIFWTENPVWYSSGSRFCRFGMRSIGKIPLLFTHAWTVTKNTFSMISAKKWKKLKNTVDICRDIWYYNPRPVRTGQGNEKLPKKWKKLLTKRKQCDNI